MLPMTERRDRRKVLERTVRALANRARDAYVVEEAHAVDPRDESGLVAVAKRLRMELLQDQAGVELGIPRPVGDVFTALT
jgi:hypothetical protein